MSGRFGQIGVMLGGAMLFAQVAAEPLVIVGDDWCPYNCDDPDRPGFMIEAAREILAAQGREIDYRLLPWARAKRMVTNGQATAIVGMTHTANTAEFYHFPDEPFAESRFCFFTRADDEWTYLGAGSLNGRTLGAVNDYGYAPDGSDFNLYMLAEAAKPGGGSVRAIAGAAGHQAQLLMLLKRERVDAIIEDPKVLATVADAQAVRLAGCLPWSDRVTIGFSRALPDGEALATQFANGLRALKASGRLDELLKRYVSAFTWP